MIRIDQARPISPRALLALKPGTIAPSEITSLHVRDFPFVLQLMPFNAQDTESLYQELRRGRPAMGASDLTSYRRILHIVHEKF
jgi:hypothetical protein